MAQIKVPDAPKEYATTYSRLLGVDFQQDQTEVDRRRSPAMVNMISDYGGNPIKRDGYRRVSTAYIALVTVDSQMYGISSSAGIMAVSKMDIDGYVLDVDETTTLNIVIGDVNSVVPYQQYIYVLAEKAFVRFDTTTKTFAYVGTGTNMMSTGTIGESAPVFSDNIPVTVITLKPDGTGGAVYENKNLFSIYQTYQYIGDGSSTTYVIPNYSKIGTYVKAEVKDANGDWQAASVTLGTPTSVTGKTIDGSTTMSNSIIDASVTITPAPADNTSAGEDNVRITFAPYSTEQVALNVNRGYYNEKFVELLESNITTFQNARLFIADKYRVYYSDVGNPFKVSDLSWFEVDNEIICFTRTSNYLAVITKDNGRNTIFLASEQTKVIDNTTGETEVYFQIKPSNSGVGAVSGKCTGTLSDEPVFLSNTGLYGLLTNWQSEKYAVNRSGRVNRKLCKEENLESAVGISYNDYFYVAINGRMYVFDARHKESDKAGNKPYEAYFFDNMPVVLHMAVINNKMYFTDSNYTYTWNEDLDDDAERYLDDAYVDDGVFTGTPVHATWSSVFDDDGYPQRLKVLMKKGSMITIVPYAKSGVSVTLVKDGDDYQYLGYVSCDLASFANIDFENFTFNANAVAYDRFTKKKVKKYKRLQIIAENDKAEPFGITKIVKTYTFGNYAKR